MIENKKSSSWTMWISTAGGLGLLPLMPGTWGTFAGVLIHGLGRMIFSSSSGERFFIGGIMVGIFCVSAIVLPDACRLWNEKDPGKFVLDEVAGYLVVPLLLGRSLPFWIMAVGGFLLFRFFDIIKPPGARYMDRRGDFIGVMLDDIVSGVYAAVSLAVLCYVLELK
ncbi:MAG: phosphatidylglycerophosphatase A [Thermodesulforhabdaceae bacterium]